MAQETESRELNQRSKGGVMRCHYCGNKAERVTGKIIYPHLPELHDKMFYRCEPCGAYVGCHANGKVLGRLANAELRRAKIQVHTALDPLWQQGNMTRKEAYRYLAKKMGIPVKKCHVGWFDLETCRKAFFILTKEAKEG